MSFDIKINAGSQIGAIKPVNGTCNAPHKTISKYFRQANLPYTRLHDSFLGHHPCVDVPVIFPDFDADETDPKNYDFAITDYYINTIYAANPDIKIIYRLGMSMQGGPFPKGNTPPTDNEKWARICANIIRHYNDGWASGFRYNIEYWEIWNEPDADHDNNTPQTAGQWSGTSQQFFEFYCTASSALKKQFPHLKIGGYASCSIDEPKKREFFWGILDYMDNAPHALDFLSFHLYGDSVTKIKNRVNFIKKHLSEHNKNKVELVCTEHSYFWESDGIWPRLGDENGEYYNEELFDSMASIKGGAFTLAALITYQNLPVDIACLYRTDNGVKWDTTWNTHGVPQKPYYALLAFKEIADRKTQLALETAENIGEIHALCAGSESDMAIVISNYYATDRDYKIKIDGLDPQKSHTAECYLTDHNKNHELSEVKILAKGQTELDIYLRAPSMTTILLKAD